MKFSLAIITALAGLAVATPVAQPNAEAVVEMADNVFEARKCFGGDAHCDNDGQCCSKKCRKRLGSVKRCAWEN